MATYSNPWTNGGWGNYFSQPNGGYGGPVTPAASAPPTWSSSPSATATPSSGPNAGVTGWYNPATGAAAQQSGGSPVSRTMGGASPGTNQYTPDFSGGLLSGPGYGEQFYTQHQGQYNQPSQASQYWNGIQGQFTQPYDSSGFNNAYNQFLFGMGNQGGPMQGTQGAYNYASQLGAGPGMGEQAARTAGQYFGQQGTGEGYINNLMGSGYFSQPGAAEDYYNQNRTFFGTSGQGENYVNQNIGQLSGPGAAETNYDQARQALAGINYGQQGIDLINRGSQDAQNTLGYYKATEGTALTNPVQAEYDQYFAPGLRDKSYSEQLYDSGNNATGLLQPYARAQELQSKALNDQMAARGLFGSGAALRGQEELSADIGAQNANARISLANQADQQRLARTAEAQNFSTAGANDLLAHRQFGLGAATAADQSQQGLMGLGLNAFGQASQEGLSKVNLQSQAANNAEQGLISRVGTGGQLALGAQNAAQARVMGGGQLANEAQSASMARTVAGGNMAAQGQQLGMDRNRGLLSAGQIGQQLQDQRLINAGQLGMQADQSEQQRQASLLNAGKLLTDVNRDTFLTNRDTQQAAFNNNTAIDNQSWGRYLDAQNMATGAQNSMENRLRNGLSDMSGAASAQSTAVLNALDAADRERFQAQISDIEAQMTGDQQHDAYLQQQINQILQSAATLVKSKGGK